MLSSFVVISAGADEHVVLDDRVGGEPDVRLDPHTGADRGVVPDGAPASNDGLRADHGALADVRLVADDAALAEPGAGEDDRARAHDRPGAHDQGLRRPAGRARVGRERGLPAEDGAVLHRAALSEHDAVVDHHVRPQRDALRDLHVVPDDQPGRAARWAKWPHARADTRLSPQMPTRQAGDLQSRSRTRRLAAVRRRARRRGHGPTPRADPCHTPADAAGRGGRVERRPLRRLGGPRARPPVDRAAARRRRLPASPS